jgi:hypothetical protein
MHAQEADDPLLKALQRGKRRREDPAVPGRGSGGGGGGGAAADPRNPAKKRALKPGALIARPAPGAGGDSGSDDDGLR